MNISIEVASGKRGWVGEITADGQVVSVVSARELEHFVEDVLGAIERQLRFGLPEKEAA